jgi:photosystem II stability/assembly factor-like uncharacterized protein
MNRSLYVTLLLLFAFGMSWGQKKDNQENGDKSPLNASTFSGMAFRDIGPALTSGRISDFAVNPDDPSTYYVATSSGGVWKTDNAGTTYQPIFDSQGSYSIGCVTLEPGNPHVVWVGTGENNNQRSVAYGDGIYKSHDGGQGWEHMGLKNSEHIGRIIVDPTNTDVVYVAAIGPLWSAGGDRGVYKTTDGGKTWNRVLYISENTGVTDIAMDPRDPNVLYAAAHQRRRRVFAYISGGPESAIYKSTDGGATWNKIMKGMPSVDIGRIGLAISPVNPDYVFAMVEAAEDKGGFYRSVNRGASWNKLSDYTTSGNYYIEIFADPVDIDRIYAMDTWFHWSEDGGKTFKKLNETWKHVDNHALWINPDDNKHLLVGCDGGIYESWDNGAHWHFKPNLPVTQFYKVSADNSEPFYYVYGGTQDNFTLGGPSRTLMQHGIMNQDWFITHGGDGFETVIDPKDPNIVYSQSQYGWLARYDRASGEEISIKPIEPEGEAYRWNWDAPLIISPHNHKRLYFAANKVFRSNDRGDSWDVISPDLSRQLDRNQLEVMGKVWSMDAVAKNNSTTIYGNIVALAESPIKEGLLYAGTDDGLIHVSKDGGENWTKYSSFPGVPDRTYVNMIIASQFDENTVFAAFNNHKNGDFKPYILKSTNAGASWTSINGDLPERGSVYSLAQDHENKELLFAGTEFGVFFTVNGGQKWIQLKGGMPTIAVRDMDIQRRENDLVLATFGRGFRVLDDYTPLRQISETALEQEALLFPVKDALMYVEQLPLGLRGKSFQGASFYTAENPPFGAVFTYYLKEGIKTQKEERQEREKSVEEDGGTVKYPPFEDIRTEDREVDPYLVFTVKDSEGNVVRRLTQKPSKGIHRVAWDLRLESASPATLKTPSLDNPFSDPDRGPLALPGKYTVSFGKVVDGKYTELAGPQEFEAVPLNLGTLAADDKTAVLAFQKELAELSRAVDGTNSLLRDTEEKLKLMWKAIERTPEVSVEDIAKIKALRNEIDDLQIKLNGDASLARRNFETPPSISGRVGAIVYGLWTSTSAPTQTQRDSYEVAAEAFEPVLGRVKEMVTQDIPELEAALESAKAPYTPGRIPEWKND